MDGLAWTTQRSASRHLRHSSGVVGLDVGDGDKRQADVSHLLQEAVQGRLIDDRAAEHGRAIALVAEGHSIEPGGPTSLQVPPESDLVPFVLGAIVSWAARLSHCALSLSGQLLRRWIRRAVLRGPTWTWTWGVVIPTCGDRREDSFDSGTGAGGATSAFGLSRAMRSWWPGPEVDRPATGGRALRLGGPRHDGW